MLKKSFISLVLLFSFCYSYEITVKPFETYTPGYRIVINADIQDNLGVFDARVYFKSKKQKNYLFYSSMSCKDKQCQGVIPVPAKFTTKIDYLILYQNNDGEIFKSTDFTLSEKSVVELPSWQVYNTEKMTIKTERKLLPRQLYGFDDNVRVEQIPDERKIGLLAKVNDEKVSKEEILKVTGSYQGFVSIDENTGEEPWYTSPYFLGGALLFFLVL